LSGLRAAALASLGVTVHARGLIPEGLAEVPASFGLPSLGDAEFVVRALRDGSRGPAAELAQAILASGDRLQRPAV
jgi:AcrR family transcriptional regulator